MHALPMNPFLLHKVYYVLLRRCGEVGLTGAVESHWTWLGEEVCRAARFGKRVTAASQEPVFPAPRRGTECPDRPPCDWRGLVTECTATWKGTELIKSKDTQRSSVQILPFVFFLVAVSLLHFKGNIPGFIQTKTALVRQNQLFCI